MPKKMAVVLVLALSLTVPQVALALHPELSGPEKVELNHKTCQKIMHLGNKYKVQGLFSQDFVQGKGEHSYWPYTS